MIIRIGAMKMARPINSAILGRTSRGFFLFYRRATVLLDVVAKKESGLDKQRTCSFRTFVDVFKIRDGSKHHPVRELLLDMLGARRDIAPADSAVQDTRLRVTCPWPNQYE